LALLKLAGTPGLHFAIDAEDRPLVSPAVIDRRYRNLNRLGAGL